MKKKFLFLVSSYLMVASTFSQATSKQNNQQRQNMTSRVAPDSLDTKMIEEVMGRKGAVNGKEFKVTVPQNDLKVEVDGFKIIPAMGLGTWIAFTPSPEGAMIMGDIILTEKDLKPVQREAINQGLTISAIHNHFVRNHPNIMYMHIGGMGNTKEMATKAKAILDKVSESRGSNPSATASDSVSNTLDVKMLDGIIGGKGELSKGVYKYTIGRADVNLLDHGVKVSTFLGFNTWAAWQGSPDNAAVAGDFTMVENEVDPVIKALISNGIEVVAVHNHMVHDQPRIFFLHYWGTGNAEQLAKGLKAALNQTGKTTTDKMKM